MDTPHGPTSALFDGVPRADTVLVLGHGAGKDMGSEFMTAVARGLAERDLSICRFNFLYAERARRAPDREPVLEETFTAVAEDARRRAGAARMIVGGKSLGGRIAAHVAGRAPVAGLVLLGYPLHPPGRPERLRDEALRRVRAPMLFVEGTRDPFCPLPTLTRVVAGIAHADVVTIAGGDHSFQVRRASGRTTQDAWREVTDAVASWIERLEGVTKR